MHKDKVFSAYYISSALDYTSELAIATMALIETRVPHIFCIATDNGFSFWTEVMGIRPNGLAVCTMAIKHPPSNSEMNTMMDINPLLDIEVQLFTKLSSMISMLWPTHRIIHNCCVPYRSKETLYNTCVLENYVFYQLLCL